MLCESYKKSIDLILCDVIMPEMKGPELIRRLHHLQPTMKVLFMSGYTDSAFDLQKMLKHSNAYIQKPFTPKILLKKIRDVLAMAAQPADKGDDYSPDN